MVRLFILASGMLRLVAKAATAAADGIDHAAPRTFVVKGRRYDCRYWRLGYLDDAPPMHAMGSGWEWEEDVVLERKERWHNDYGVVVDHQVDSYPKRFLTSA